MPGVIEDVARALDPEAFRIADRYTGRLTALANARGVLRTLLSGPVGDVLRAARHVESDAIQDIGGTHDLCVSPTDWKGLEDALAALPPEITDMLGDGS